MVSTGSRAITSGRIQATTGNAAVSITTGIKSEEVGNKKDSIVNSLIGGIVAALVFIAVLAAAIFVIVRKLKSKRDKDYEGEDLPQIAEVSIQPQTQSTGGNQVINFSELKLMEVLGKGSFGVVYRYQRGF